jgi:hypothetical protein
MSRNSLIFGQEVTEDASPAPPNGLPGSGEYLDLVRRLFQSHSVVAVLDSGSRRRGREACRGIAVELAAARKRVVIVQVDELLRMRQSPDVTRCSPGPAANVSLWPSAAGAPVEFFQSPPPPRPAGDWLDWLRRNFDAVVLDCPPAGAGPATAEIAAMADSALLVVEAGRTTKQQIQRDQRTLRLRGVKLAGCILMLRR